MTQKYQGILSQIKFMLLNTTIQLRSTCFIVIILDNCPPRTKQPSLEDGFGTPASSHPVYLVMPQTLIWCRTIQESQNSKWMRNSISSSLTFILGQLNCLQTGHCLTLINKPKNPRMNKAGERNRIRERYMGDRIILENGSNRECSN